MRYVRLALGLILCASLSNTLSPEPAYAQSSFCSIALQSAGAGSAVTLSDTTVLSPPSRALYVGATGDLKVRMAGDGSTLTFVGVPGGTLLPLCTDMVYSTGTTATSVVLLR